MRLQTVAYQAPERHEPAAPDAQRRLLQRLRRGPLLAEDVALIARTDLVDMAMRPLVRRGLALAQTSPRGATYWTLSETGQAEAAHG